VCKNDHRLVINVKSILENLADVLINNYFFLYPAFIYFLKILEEMDKISPKSNYSELQITVINNALDKLISFKPINAFEMIKLERNKDCARVLKAIYDNLPEILDKTFTSVPEIIKTVIKLSYDERLYFRKKSLIKKVAEVLKKYPQLLIQMSNSEIERLKLEVNDLCEITISFANYVVSQIEHKDINFLILQNDQIQLDFKSQAMVDILVLFLKQLKTIGYTISLRDSEFLITLQNREDFDTITTPYFYPIQNEIKIQLPTENHKKFFEHVLKKLENNEN
jgi:hypothetical protein